GCNAGAAWSFWSQGVAGAAGGPGSARWPRCPLVRARLHGCRQGAEGPAGDQRNRLVAANRSEAPRCELVLARLRAGDRPRLLSLHRDAETVEWRRAAPRAIG